MNKERHSQTKKSRVIQLDRINPQFIGIAERFAAHKKNRLHIEKQKMRKTSNFQFLRKMDQTLEKDVEKQRQQLARVREIRQRYNQDNRHKEQQQQRRRQQIQFLHNKSTDHRMDHRKKISQAFENLMSERREKRNQLKKQNQQIRQYNYRNNKQKSLENQYKYHSIEYGKEQGQQRVNQYFRFKNKQSLNDYLKRINNEDHKAKKFKSQLKKLEKNVNKYSKKVEQKKEQLEQINSEIMYYTGDSVMLRSRYRKHFRVVSSHSKREKPQKVSANTIQII